jgi:hypothetical protein
VTDSTDGAAPVSHAADVHPYSYPPAPRRDRVWVHVLLLALTVVTTTLVGGLHHFSFTQGFNS